MKPRAPAAFEGGVEGHERAQEQRHQLVELAHRLHLGTRGVDGAHLARVVQRVVEPAGGVDVGEHVDEADLAAHALEEGRCEAHVVVGVAVQPPHEGHDVDHHAPRAQHAVALGQHLVRIGDVLEHRVRPDAVHGAGAEGQRGGVGHDVDRVRGIDVEADELGQAVGVGQLARALVAERGPRAELEVDGAAVHRGLVGGGARRVPLRARAGEQRVDAVEQVRPPCGEVPVQCGHQRVGLAGRLGPDGLLDEVEETLDAFGIGPPGHGIDAGPPAHPRDHASVPPIAPRQRAAKR